MVLKVPAALSRNYLKFEKQRPSKNYKKSVKLNPGNENGIKILKDNGIKTDDLIKKVPIDT